MIHYSATGNPYGTSLVTGQEQMDELPGEIEAAARYQGKRWATVAAQLKGMEA